MFFKKKIFLDCYTTNPVAFNNAKITSGIHHYPDWWKSLPPSGCKWHESFEKTGDLAGRNTMKDCVGYTGLYKKSFVLPLWCSARFCLPPENVSNEPFHWLFSDEVTDGKMHSSDEHNGHLYPTQYQHFKIFSPWVLKCSEPIQWAWVPPAWETVNAYDQINIVPAVIDFFHNHATHVNMFMKKKPKVSYIELPFNFPLAHLIPLTERKVVLRHHLVSSSELFKVDQGRAIGKYRIAFNKEYQARKKLKG